MNPKLAGIVITISSLAMVQSAVAAGAGTHHPGAQYGARLAPEPFKSNSEACIGAMIPDLMRDHPVGHENHRAAGLLYTFEAIRLLRKGETAKALAVASMRCHYLEDSICIAHSDIWYPRDPGDVLTPGVPGKRVWSFMPQSAQGYWLPFDPRKPGFIHYDRLRIDPPPLQVESWDKLAKRKLSRNMHTFFDSTALHRGHKAGEFPLDHVPDTTNWSAYDYEIYTRWRSDQIALEVLDRESVLQQKGDGWIKFAGAVSFQKAMDHEMENIIAAVSAYYRYLTVARDTEVGGGLDTLPRGEDHLLLMSLHKPAIYVADDAPWPLKRACRLLAFEMVRARHRSLGNFDATFAQNLMAEVRDMIHTVAVPEGEGDRRMIISWGKPREDVIAAANRPHSGNSIIGDDVVGLKGHITLRGNDLQSTIHLVDYLLDLTYAPFNGRAPMKVLYKVMESEWDGLALMEKIRLTPDDQLQALLGGVKNNHGYTDFGDLTQFNRWRQRVYDSIRPHTAGSDINLTGVLPRFYAFFVLGMELPDGTRIDLSKL